MVHVEKYDPSRASEWNRLVSSSRNGTFLFNRAYMDYHADRFTDASLFILDEQVPVAVFPANQSGDVVQSHAGLSYGGLISAGGVTAALVLQIFDRLIEYWRAEGITRVEYKAVPRIYHAEPAEEDLYALFRNGAKLYRRDLSSTLELGRGVRLTKGRKWAINRARKLGITVERSYAFGEFMDMEAALLEKKYGVAPVHSGAEMRQLAEAFPDNILMYAAAVQNRMLAGTILYVTDTVVHAQYIAATDEGRHLCATDAVISHIIQNPPGRQRFFDFGISTEEKGTRLNEGLVANKESWGARATTCDFYELCL